jgi:ankyrin repeat protein
MDTQKRKRDQFESDTLTHLRRGTLDILDAVAVQLPDVFYDEILPKLSLEDTCNLAQVNRAYRDAVWSAEGVRSLGTKVDYHVDEDIVQYPMYWMAKSGNYRAVRALLQSGVDAKEVYGAGDTTALHAAAEYDHALMALDLIDAGADLDARNWIGQTPLYNAVEHGNTSVVMALTKLGADVNLSLADYDNSDTLLDIAIAERYGTIAALLISHGADIRKVNTALRDEAKHLLDLEEDKGFGKLIRVAERLAPSE